MTYDEVNRTVIGESQYEAVLLATKDIVVKAMRVSGSEWRIVVCKNFSKRGDMWGFEYIDTVTEPTASEMLEAIKTALKHAGVSQDEPTTTE